LGEVNGSIKVRLAQTRAQPAHFAKEQYGEAAQQSEPESKDGYPPWASREGPLDGSPAEDTPLRRRPHRQRTQVDRFSPEPFFQSGIPRRESGGDGEAQLPEENARRSTRSVRLRGDRQPGFFDAPIQDPDVVVHTQDDDDSALDESGIKVTPPFRTTPAPPFRLDTFRPIDGTVVGWLLSSIKATLPSRASITADCVSKNGLFEARLRVGAFSERLYSPGGATSQAASKQYQYLKAATRSQGQSRRIVAPAARRRVSEISLANSGSEEYEIPSWGRGMGPQATTRESRTDKTGDESEPENPGPALVQGDGREC